MGTIYYAIVGPPSSGGERVNEEHVCTLRAHGFRAFQLYFHSNSLQRFPTNAPTIINSNNIKFSRDDIVVIPEGWSSHLKALSATPCRKILHCQNPYYVFFGVDTVVDYEKYGIEHALTCSNYTAKFLKRHGFQKQVSVVRPSIEDYFYNKGSLEAKKRLQVAYMPRKLKVQAQFIRGLFKFTYPELSGVPWIAIENTTREACADILRESAVFASFSDLEGLGLPPLEAMAAGCVVAGFHGGGGLEYANDSNGFWAPSGDFEACTIAISKAIGVIGDEAVYSKISQSMERTISSYSKVNFTSSLISAWHTVLGDSIEKYLLDSN